MFARIARGWGMAKASWAVLRQHPKLLLFPVFSGIAFLALITVIGVSVFAAAESDYVRHAAQNARVDKPVICALLFAFYFASTLIIVFFNAALLRCAPASLRRRDACPRSWHGPCSPRRSGSFSMRSRTSSRTSWGSSARCWAGLARLRGAS